MNIEIAREKLAAQGFTEAMINSMIKSLTKPEKEVKPKRFFPGAVKKIEVIVEITCYCECCGSKTVTTKAMLGTKDSPETMKISTSICNSCPDFFRKLTHEQLVSLMIAKEHPGISMLYKRCKSQIGFAMKYTPEELVVLKASELG